MHNNYYFLRHLSAELNHQIVGFTLVSCFSQNKDELVLELNNERKSIFIKATLLPTFQCLSFPDLYHRARKNSINLFNDLVMTKVTGVRQFTNERSLALLFENDNTLVFKMHGAQSNVIRCKGAVTQEIFRNNIKADLDLRLDNLDRSIDWSYANFMQHQADLPGVYFTFGKAIWNYINAQHFSDLDIPLKWKVLTETLTYLEKPNYYLQEKESVISLSLFPSEERFTRPIEAINEFFKRRVTITVFQKEKASLLSYVQGKIKQSESYQDKNRRKYIELTRDTHYKQWADLIMANLHRIKPAQEIVELEDFYNKQQTEIRLKKELSPQKNAEVFYRKAKNQAIEVNTLKEALDRKEMEIRELQKWDEAIRIARNISDLEVVSAILVKHKPAKELKQSLPFHEFEFLGFKIWVGKNATSNDTLTLKHSHKDDLWLHAKDVAGSHVLIKYQAGKPFPKDVIERAASLAAYYSKRKNETLCPVAITPRKYVRKRKGDPAGAVVVEREKVMLVEPKR